MMSFFDFHLIQHETYNRLFSNLSVHLRNNDILPRSHREEPAQQSLKEPIKHAASHHDAVPTEDFTLAGGTGGHRFLRRRDFRLHGLYRRDYLLLFRERRDGD